MQETANIDSEIVTTGQRLDEIVAAGSQHPRVAIDIESNGFFRYPERVCLIQLAVGDSVFLIDPLAVPDVTPLGKLIGDSAVEKVLHSGDYDIRSLDRDYGFRMRNLFDTSIAAAFVGSTSLGLAAVLQEYLGVEVGKSKRLQRSDWSIRPLNAEAREYAAQDVRHLAPLRATLGERLAALGRLDWVDEECERLAGVRYQPPDREWAFASMKGSRVLDGRGLAVLRSLHRFREQEAVRRDRPPFKVVSNEVLLEIAASPGSDLSRIKGIGRFGHPPAVDRVRAAIRDGLRVGPIKRPRAPSVNGVRAGRAEREAIKVRLKRLKEWRASVGGDLGLDPGLLWPAASLERLAAQPETLDAELGSPVVREWQRRELAAPLRDFAAGLG